MTVMTDRQANYVTRLVEQINGYDPSIGLEVGDFKLRTTRDASAAIDALKVTLKALRQATGDNEPPQLAEGYYVDEFGAAYQVIRSKASGNLYAKKINEETGRYEFCKGAIYQLRDASPLTLEQAAHYGKVTGRCIVCARLLTNLASIERGIGPVCAKRFG